MLKNYKSHQVVPRLAAVLLCLVLITTGMVAGWYARYITTDTDTDEARIAQFRIVETGELMTESLEVGITPGGEQEIVVTVENAGEVAIRYRIDADNPYRNLPLDFQIRLGSTLHSVPFEAEMAPGETRTYVLVIVWDSPERDVGYSGKVDLIEVYASATQIGS